ncbi:MAG: hypothetical protein ACKOWL_06655, partial [Sphingobacteriaceae bacterium]
FGQRRPGRLGFRRSAGSGGGRSIPPRAMARIGRHTPLPKPGWPVRPLDHSPTFDTISDQEIISYLQIHADEWDTELLLANTENLHLEKETISTQELENYVNQSL